MDVATTHVVHRALSPRSPRDFRTLRRVVKDNASVRFARRVTFEEEREFEKLVGERRRERKRIKDRESRRKGRGGGVKRERERERHLCSVLSEIQTGILARYNPF